MLFKLFQVGLSGLLWVAAATPALAQSSSVAPDQLLNDFPSNPLGTLGKVHSYCGDRTNSDTIVCLSLDDMDEWAGIYRNKKIEIIPAKSVAAPPHDSVFLKAEKLLPQVVGNHGVLMVNVVHDHPETLILPYKLLGPLKKSGFSILAIEALSNAGDTYRGNGFPSYEDGYYIRNPIFADLIRQAVALGYTIVPYDAMRPGRDNPIASREQQQAENLASIVKDRPHQKMIVLAGMAHVYKTTGSYLQGQEPMAMRFLKLTGIDPFVVDQIYTFDFDKWNPWQGSDKSDYGLYVATHDGTAWSAAPSQFDVSVFARIDRSLPARKAWANSLFGLRHELKVPTSACARITCIVQARSTTNSTKESIPSDSIVIEHKNEAKLYIPKGAYRVSVRDDKGTELDSRIVQVP